LFFTYKTPLKLVDVHGEIQANLKKDLDSESSFNLDENLFFKNSWFVRFC